MKAQLVISLITLGTFFSCSNQEKISLVNPLNSDRVDEVVILTRELLAGTVNLDNEKSPVFSDENGKPVPAQLDDLDGDETWDEVVLMVDFLPNETKVLTISLSDSPDTLSVVKRTNLRLGILQDDGSYKEFDDYLAPQCDDGFEVIAQGESVSWENDKIGFRNYFDCRNVKDLFGKLKPEMVIDKIGTPEMANYHELADWGMDILHCGSSLGSGGLALFRNDSLYRLGSTGVYEYRKILEGPLRSVFKLIYKDWDIEGQKMEATEKITIYPGKYWFESDVTFKGCKDGDQIVTGIVTTKLTRQPFEFDSNGFKCIGTHDIQSLNNDELGMAAIVPVETAGKVGHAPETDYFALGFQTVVEKSFSNIVSQTYFIGQKCKEATAEKHYFFAVWGLEKEEWKTEDGFKNYINQETEKLSSKIKIL